MGMVGATKRRNMGQRGLTAIELAVVVAILAVLAGLVASSTTGMSTTARASSQSTDRTEVEKAVDNFAGQHPSSWYPVYDFTYDEGTKATGIFTPTNVVNCRTGEQGAAWDGGAVFTKKQLEKKLTPRWAGDGTCLQLHIRFAGFLPPDEGATVKFFVPDFMQHEPKHLMDYPAQRVDGATAGVWNGNTWVIDSLGKVINVLDPSQY